MESGFGVFARRIFRPYVFGQIKCRPCFRPTGIKTDVGDDFSNLGTGNAVLLCRLKMENERIVGDALADQGGDGYQTAVVQTELVSPTPYFTEKNIIVEFRKFGSKLS